jgi:hypothetical protein
VAENPGENMLCPSWLRTRMTCIYAGDLGPPEAGRVMAKSEMLPEVTRQKWT